MCSEARVGTLLFCIIFVCNFISAQDWIKYQADRQFLEYNMDKGLKVGDKMPDIPLGVVINNYTGKTRFSDFKDKLIILDFWGTNCSSCIAKFPHMESLQREFGDKIQIILVDVEESWDKIQSKFKEKEKIAIRREALNLYKLPNLPLIVADRDIIEFSDFNKVSTYKLWELFPKRAVPHHVWIKNGQIIYRGGPHGATKDNIEKVLAGKKIFPRNDNNTTIFFKKDNWPLYKLMGHFKDPPIPYGSFVTTFNNEYSAFEAGWDAQIVDTINNIKRITVVNAPVLRFLSLELWKHFFERQRERIIYPDIRYRSGNLFDLQVQDTFRYTSDFDENRMFISDAQDIRSRICYEQLAPSNTSREQMFKQAEQDIINYLARMYGAEIRTVRKKIECYVLIRTSNIDKIKLTNKKNNTSGYSFSEGIRFRRLSGDNFYYMVSIFHKSPLQKLFYKNGINGVATSFLLNETGFDNNKRVDMILPCEESLQTLDQLRDALKKYDLDIKKEIREVEYIQISDK